MFFLPTCIPNVDLSFFSTEAQGVLHTALQEGTEEEEEVVEEEAAAENVTEAAADEAAPPEEQVKKTKKKKKKRKKEKVPGGAISAECGDCLAAVGQVNCQEA